MKHLGLALTLLLVSMTGRAQALEYTEGRVVYSASCESKRVFLYFDGARLRRPCIGSTDQVSAQRIIRLSNVAGCRRQIRVNAGTVENGVLYAADIEEGRNCSDFGRGDIEFP